MAMSKKVWLGGMAALALAGLCGCNSSQKTASPGVVGEKKAGCCEGGGTCTDAAKKDTKASPGVLGEKKAGSCCSQSQAK
jgi:hypothetical protein